MKIVKVIRESVSQRLALCEACENFNAERRTCKKCGCYMPAKVYLITASCPIGKWGGVSVADIRAEMATLRRDEKLQKLKD